MPRGKVARLCYNRLVDTADTETPVARLAEEQFFTGSSDGSSDLDDVGDEEDEMDNTKFIPSYAYSTISFQKRQALVTYFENNRAGITIYGFMLDRTSLHTIFGIEMSLVLWLLGKTRSMSTATQHSVTLPDAETTASHGDGRITANDASKFFTMSNLPRQDLKQVWAIADSKRQGFLGFKEFVIAMQLVSLAQAGHTLTSDVLDAEVDFENLQPPPWKKKKRSSEPEQNGKMDDVVCIRRLVPSSTVTSIVDGLKKLYVKKLKPLEVTYRFNEFVSPSLINSDFDAKPMVMLLGQYSTGKTTFIKHLLRTSYPGANIGPEPTTDRFVVVMNGPDERSVPGNTVAVQADMPFSGLTTFGTAFLSKFECSQMPHPLLEHISFVDTPGVLSGEKQRTQRSYDFTGVISWFASKCDLILLLFDPHKLDISDEFKRVIESLRDTKAMSSLMTLYYWISHTAAYAGIRSIDVVPWESVKYSRGYACLSWVSSLFSYLFRDLVIIEIFSTDIMSSDHQRAFEKEQDDLLSDLKDIPKKACDRRINEFVKRARAAKIHAYIISHLRNEMPAMIGKAKTQQRLIDNLDDEFAKVQREHHLPAGDFPNADQFREKLSGYSIDKFERLKPKMIQSVDDMLGYDIPQLLKSFRNPYD
ncbi:hypothetical protein DH2020_008697 [Rehmannia glutinosa]|uniref:EH domain-containing protein n=1 Tax=Rehmannia glutinosa TaxID=99300 RepID=A0ABR0X4T4_REHGL